VLRRPLLSLVLAALALIAAACGGSAANGYRSQVGAAEARHGAELRAHEQRLGAAIHARRPAVAAREATAASALAASVEQDVAALHPPKTLQVRSRTLLSAYRELVQSLDQIAQAFGAKKPAQANIAIDRYNTARLDESSAIAALNAGDG
jgi:nitrate/nitrite-specific signal transduction histidine kinase